MKEFNWPIRVYYEDTDAAGLVYHANYLRFMERARTEWLRELGFTHRKLNEEIKLQFVVSSIEVRFRKPAYFDEQLNVCSRVTGMGGTSMVFEQLVNNQEDELKCQAEVNIVCVDTETFRPKRIPESIRSEFNNDN